MAMTRVSLPFHIGTDIVHLPRIRRLVTKSNGRYLAPFMRRILCPTEIDDFRRRYRTDPEEKNIGDKSDLPGIVRWLGGRFAAKEAARKAAGATTLGWKDVKVNVFDSSGRPRVLYLLRNQDSEPIEQPASLSISHDGDYVVATVLAPSVFESG